MKIICDTCGAKYSIADEKVQGKVFKIRCKKCREIIVVRGTAGAESGASDGLGDSMQSGQEMSESSDFGGGGAYDPATAAIWHVVLDGEQQGPYTAEQVGQFVAAGQLDFASYCWRDGFGDWLHIQDVDELYRVVAMSAHAQQPQGYEENLSTSVASGQAGMDAGYGGAADNPFQAAAADPYGQPGAGMPGADGGMAYGGFTAPAETPSAPASAQEAVSDLFGGAGGQAGYQPQRTSRPAAAMGAAAVAPAALSGAGFTAPAASGVAARGSGHDVGADLFAPTSDDGGGMFPQEQGAADVMTSSPRVDVSRMTGTRNENSVLFSLSNLQALAAGGPTASVTSAKAGPSRPMGSGHAVGEGSGLIDIRAMAAAAASDESSSGGGVDDLLAIGGGGGFAPTLGAPVLMAQPQASSSKLVYALVGVGALVVVAVGVLIVVLMTAQPTQTVVAGAQPSVLTAPIVPPAASPGAAAAQTQPGVQPPTTPTPANVQPISDGAGEGGGDSEGDAARRTSGGTKRPRGGDSASTSGGGGGSTSGGGGSTAPAASSGGTSKRGGSSSLDDLLDGALGGGGGGGGGTKRPAAAAESSGGGDDASLPQTLSRSQVQSGMNSVAGRVRQCGAGQRGTVMVNVVISGSTGRVSSATVEGSFAGTPVGSCAARAVRGARFQRFRQSSLTVRYPFQVQ